MDLAPGAAAAGVGLIACDTVSSTNAEALAYARAGEKGPLWITARAQTGRGVKVTEEDDDEAKKKAAAAKGVGKNSPRGRAARG